jgi:hypothetical protein
VRYDYDEGLYQCAKRRMRLPTVDELKALFAYANAGNSTATDLKFAIVASKGDLLYPGGLYGWGGGSLYWTHTFAGRGSRKAVDLSNGQVTIYYRSHLGYVSCVH